MGTYILTSMFEHGFQGEIAELFQKFIRKREKFVFVASEFEKAYEITDRYYKWFLNMFDEAEIYFGQAKVIDGRMTKTEARKMIEEADVVWLAGGDTITQFHYFQEYNLDKVIKEHEGIVIGMSAGAINLSKNAICTEICGHDKFEIYEGLGCVDISVEPHFDIQDVSNELLELSTDYEIYGLCDEGVIVYKDGIYEFYGEVYKIEKGAVVRV